MEADVEGIGQRTNGMTVAPQAIKSCSQAVIEPVAEPGEAGGIGIEIPKGDFAGGPESGDLEDIFGAGTEIVFVVGAMDLFFERDATADIEGADALGSVKLVAGDGEQINPQLIDADRNLAGRLGGVAMEHGAVGVGDGRQFGDGLDGADLVVGVHDADQEGLFPESGLEVAGGDHAIPVNRQNREFKAQGLEMRGHLDDGGMLNRGNDEMISLVAMGQAIALEGEVVGLGAAAGEEDLVGVATEQGGDLGARLLDGAPALLAVPVGAGGVAEGGDNERQHGGGDLGVDGCGGVVIEIDRQHLSSSG